MKLKIENRCQKQYRINIERLIEGIVKNVPEKFLMGLVEITIFDYGKAHYPITRYVIDNKAKIGKIEIYLENQILHKIPFISSLAVNIYILLAINQHIGRYLKDKTEDHEIVSFNINRVNYSWMYFPKWNPLFYIVKILNLFIAQTGFFQTMLKRWTNYLRRRL